MTIWNYLLIVSLIMNFWCVAKIDRHDRSIKSLAEASKELLNSMKCSNDHIYQLFSDILKIFKGDTHNDSDRQG